MGSMNKTADIIVIGAGVIGNGIASYLSQLSDAKILLLEQNHLCTGSTSLSASLVTKLRSKTDYIPLVQETHDAVKRMELEFGEPLGERRVGCLHLAASETSVSNLEILTGIARSFDIPFESFSQSRIQKEVPWIDSEKIQEAVFVPDEFYIDGAMLGTAFFKEAKHNGIDHKFNTVVSEIINENEKVIGVKTKNEIIHAPIVVDAAGIWSNLLLEKHKAMVPYAPVRSLYFITELNPDLYRVNQPICILPDANAYTRPESGALLFGLRDQSSPWFHLSEIGKNINDQKFISLEEQWEILLNETEGLQNLMLDFEDLKVAHTIAAPCAYTRDGNLVLGKIQQMEGLYVATGCNGGGIATSAGIGRALAEMILKKDLFISIDQYDPQRFNELNPYAIEFMQQCSDNRSNKKSG